MTTKPTKAGKRKRSIDGDEVNAPSSFPPSSAPLHIPTTYLIGAGPLLQERFRHARFDKFTSEHLADFDTTLSENHVSQLLASLGVAVCDVTSVELVTKLADVKQTMPDHSILPCLDDPTFVYALARQTIERHKGSLYAMVYDTLSPISPRSLLDIETMFMAQRLEEITQKEVAKIMAYFVSMNYAVRIENLTLENGDSNDDENEQMDHSLALTPSYYTYSPRLQPDRDSHEASRILEDPRIAHMGRLIVYELRGFRDYSQTLYRSCSGSASHSGLLPRHLLWPEMNDQDLEELARMTVLVVRALSWACSNLSQDQLRLKSFSGMELHKILNVPFVAVLDHATAVSVAHALFDLPEDWHLAMNGELEERFAKLSRTDDNESRASDDDDVISDIDLRQRSGVSNFIDTDEGKKTWSVFDWHAHPALGTPTNRTHRMLKTKRERHLRHHQKGELPDDPIDIDSDFPLLSTSSFHLGPATTSRPNDMHRR